MSYNIRYKSKNQDNSRLTVYFILGFFIVALFINLVKMVKQYVDRRAILRQEEQELATIKRQNSNLRYELKRSGTEEYIEEKARELTLSKEGEYVIIAGEPSPPPKPRKREVPHIPNYKLWWLLFFQP